MKGQDHNRPLLGKWCLWLLFLGVAALSACENQSRGFVLPEGTADTGKQVFLELNCNRCHTVDDIEWAGNERYDDPLVPLGGEVASIKTNG